MHAESLYGDELEAIVKLIEEIVAALSILFRSIEYDSHV